VRSKVAKKQWAGALAAQCKNVAVCAKTIVKGK